jgi:hypothetical protein
MLAHASEVVDCPNDLLLLESAQGLPPRRRSMLAFANVPPSCSLSEPVADDRRNKGKRRQWQANRDWLDEITADCPKKRCSVQAIETGRGEPRPASAQ